MAYAVTVVGTGRIGTTLAAAFAQAGHRVVLASRSPEAAAAGSVPTVGLDDALEDADAVVLAIPGAAVPDLLRDRRQQLAGKAVIDATNSVGAGAMHHAADAEGLAYYRAFNTLGVENFADPLFDGQAADLFFSGPENHRGMVADLIHAVGLRPVHVGEGAGAADLLDGVTRLWFTLALQQGRGRHLAFRMLP